MVKRSLTESQLDRMSSEEMVAKTTEFKAEAERRAEQQRLNDDKMAQHKAELQLRRLRRVNGIQGWGSDVIIGI